MSTRERERQILERLRESYESDGYQFFMEPSDRLLPAELMRLRPDALAIRGDDKRVIEIKATRHPSTGKRLADVARTVEALGPGWTLVVYHANEIESPPTAATATDVATLTAALDEARTLSAAGHHAAALIIGWGVLEAVARKSASHEKSVASTAIGATRAVDFLEQNGELDFQQAATLRGLASLRNAVVHGDFSRNVDAAAVGTLVDCVAPLVVPDVPEAAQ